MHTQAFSPTNAQALTHVLTRFVQAHKQLDGRGEDMFCEARNFFIDFSKVRFNVMDSMLWHAGRVGEGRVGHAEGGREGRG